MNHEIILLILENGYESEPGKNGNEIGSCAAISCVISFLITGHRGIFPTQVLMLRKSSSLGVDVGKEVGAVSAEFKPRDKSLIGVVLKLLKKITKNSEKT